ncbi:MAG: hypothetical protein GFH27_549327n4 [Chloroflexi bacterium AL-W]|nr:hypothetical protein [Chloroflexi bacterium AL-N1]NOK69616.1 hypothetical protein [Chloroflexi bacterium AL-N10]NOK72163.1 hypothetical protein [Chloroflexi bacterium AL-N5]NOK84992.1 hypothetical protein [Chloroflexi bacterium AL-W]NOK91745.1 hypothetical protein [Chloroflexi bacterium AL-N15]
MTRLDLPTRTLTFSSYLGGSGPDQATGVAVDAWQQTYITGWADWHDFPGQVPLGDPGGRDQGFLVILDASGTVMTLSTTFGGGHDDLPQALAIGQTGQVHLTGYTKSSNFPTYHAAQATGGGNRYRDAFVLSIAASVLPDDQNRIPEACPCARAQHHTADPVNTRTGTFWTQVTDLQVETPGPALAWTRSYASQAITQTHSALGPGWQHPFAARLVFPSDPDGEAGRVILFTGKTNRFRFTDLGTGQYQAFPGIYQTLEATPTGYTLTQRDQQQYLFDPTGRQVDLTYTGTGQLTAITDTADSTRSLTLTWQAHQIASVSDGTRTVTYTYDTAGDLVTVQDVMGRPTTYTYQQHLLTAITNALGEVVETISYDTYDASGKVSAQTLHDGRHLTFVYTDDATTITTVGTDGQQAVDTYRYAPNNTLLAHIHNGEAVQALATDAAFSPERVVDGNGHATHTTFTPQGLPVQRITATGQVQTMTYDAHHNLIATTDATGVTTTRTYDANQNVLAITQGITTTSPLRATTRYTYTVDHLVQEQQGPDGVVTRYHYGTQSHTARLPVEQIVGWGTATSQRTTYTYDALGRRQDTTIGAGTALARTDRTEYYPDNTVARTIINYIDGVYDPAHPDEDLITSYGYDAVGRQIWTRDTHGRYHVTHYDATGWVTWRTRQFVAPGWQGGSSLPASPPTFDPATPDQNVTTWYGYDGLGRTVLVTETGVLTGTFDPQTRTFDAATERVTFTEYDTHSRPVTVTRNYRPELPLGSMADVNVQTVTHYDGAGNVIWQRDPLGR